MSGHGSSPVGVSSSGLFSPASWERIAAQIWAKREAEGPPAVCGHSRVREFEKGVLLMEADHPGWVQILKTSQADLLLAFQRNYPELEILKLSIRLSPG